MAEVKSLAGREREATAHLIAHLAEFDARRLYLGAGFSSLFTYCMEVLRLSEAEAYNRIEAARAARRFPVILDRLAEGSLNITTVRVLASRLTADNYQELLAAASGKSRRAVVAPLAPDRYEIRLTASAETCAKLRLAQDMLRHAVPTGDTAQIIDRALTVLLQELARKKFAATDRPRASRGAAPGSRYVAAKVRRAVWIRDGGRCAFVSKGGRRCNERSFAEFHHLEPYGVGGEAHVETMELRCRAHNNYEAELFYGRRQPTRPGTSAPLPSMEATVDP